MFEFEAMLYIEEGEQGKDERCFAGAVFKGK
jgi:hypothetical protein